MNLFILRHGEAAYPRGRDAERKLTEKGRTESLAVMRALKSKCPRLDAIVSSPYLRAMATASVAAEVYGFGAEIEYTDALLPEGRPPEVEAMLHGYTQSASILLVSHMPLAGDLVAELTGGEPAFFQTSQVIYLQRNSTEDAFFISRGSLSVNNLEAFKPIS